MTASKSSCDLIRQMTTGRSDRTILHLAVLYALVVALFVTTAVVYFTSRDRVERIADELVELRTRFNESVAADRSLWWRPRAVAVGNSGGGDKNATSRRRLHYDGVSKDAAALLQPRRRRDATEHGGVTTSSSMKTTDDDGDIGIGSGEVPTVDGWQMIWTNDHSKIPQYIKEICARVNENCALGKPGPQGERGPPGLPGSPGPGIPGAKGEPGEKGEHGEPGPIGQPGTKGDPGAHGSVGTPGGKGERGDPGIAGLPGPVGARGEDGANGTKGEKGEPGQMGVMGPPGQTGPKGDCGDVTLNETMVGVLKGEKGDPGIKGEPGNKGLPGATGDKGAKGDPGEPGQQGIAGPAGVNGTEGPRGRRGRPGEAGASGAKGEKGAKGDTGRGEKGDKGIAGPPGMIVRADNTSGPYIGMRGMPGPPGLPGAKGNKGDPGYSCGCADLTTEELTTEMMTTAEPTIEPRTHECRIRAIGKPVFQTSTKTNFGMWLKDAYRNGPFGDRIWLTKHFTGNTLFGYDGFERLRHDSPSTTCVLKELYFGTGNVVYNGSFYYHRAGHNEIIKYDLLRNETVAKIAIHQAAYQSKDYIYSTGYNYFDLTVEENGLWTVFTHETASDFLRVSKLDLADLAIQKTWTIYSARPKAFGNGWITCGVLYLVPDVTKDVTIINFAYDLYTGRQLNVSLRFHNPYHMNNMIAYNHNEKVIYSWDMGYLLTYPLLL